MVTEFRGRGNEFGGHGFEGLALGLLEFFGSLIRAFLMVLRAFVLVSRSLGFLFELNAVSGLENSRAHLCLHPFISLRARLSTTSKILGPNSKPPKSLPHKNSLI